MNQAIQEKSESNHGDVVTLDDAREQLTKRPLAAAPRELQHFVWRLWAVHQHLFESPLAIAAAVGIWCNDFGLRIDDAEAILKAMLAPRQMATFKFKADLMTELAAAAAEAIRRRQSRGEISRQQSTESGGIISLADQIGAFNGRQANREPESRDRDP